MLHPKAFANEEVAMSNFAGVTAKSATRPTVVIKSKTVKKTHNVKKNSKFKGRCFAIALDVQKSASSLACGSMTCMEAFSKRQTVFLVP
mmetsp:Transcript_24343/g.34370  ORF Transcript_24343/g.34370 Transcript_24343/m.34370 type:complete len:89 (+) Transcript_24343:194-460(+)